MDCDSNDWTNTKAALGVLEKSLSCPICSGTLEDPCGLGNCEHTFCRACIGHHLGNTCPVCSAPAWVKDLNPKRQLSNVVHLCKKLRKVIEGKYIRNEESQNKEDVLNDQNHTNNGSDDDEENHDDDDDYDERERDASVKGKSETAAETGETQNRRTTRKAATNIQYKEESEDEIEEEMDEDNAEQTDGSTPDNNDINDADFDPGVGKKHQKQRKSKRQILKEKSVMVLTQNTKRKIETKFSPKTSILRYTVNLRTRKMKARSPNSENMRVTRNSESKSSSEASTSSEDTGQNVKSDDCVDVFNFIASPTSPKPTKKIKKKNPKTSLKKKITAYNKEWGLKSGRSRRKPTVDKGSCSHSGSDTESERKVSFVEVDENESGRQDNKLRTDKEQGRKAVRKTNLRQTGSRLRESANEESDVLDEGKGSGNEPELPRRKRRSTEKTENDQPSPGKKAKQNVTTRSRRDRRSRNCQGDENSPAWREKSNRRRSSPSPRKIKSPGVSSTKSTPKSNDRRTSSGSLNSPFGSLTKKNAKGETLLQRAAIKGDFDGVKTLLEAGANPNTKDNAGWTPLHEACHHGYLEIVNLLLDNGALINVPGFQNESPLHDAICNNRVEVVKLLVKRGASLDVRNVHGLTPRDLAISDVMKDALDTAPMVTLTQQNSLQKAEQHARLSQNTEIVLIGTALKREHKVKLEQCAKLLKGRVVEDFDNSVTHVVTSCNQDGQCARTMKFLQGILHGKWIVSYDWVKRCLEKDKQEDEQYFEVTGTSIHPFTLGPRKARQNSEQQCPGFFNGIHFYFYGHFNAPTPSKAELSNLVKSGDGTLLLREPKPDDCNQPGGTVPYHAVTDSKQSECTHYIIYDHFNKKPPAKIRTPKLCTASSSWLMDCITQFTILDLTD
ncbi:BRCA1-associated RING domain protein 1-like [Ptychodera flava]|uniref:BRCA1-associated RING domain protein 1-like n=1 Tax=Ptychodera flava TaxID=63121 RepID=UPI00396A5230